MATERLAPLPSGETLLPQQTDVVIVGAGLSGLSLASVLSETNVDFIVVDKRTLLDPKEAMYLVSKNIANTWGMEVAYETKRGHQPLISGAVSFDEGGEVIWSIDPNTDNSYGFAPLPQTLLEKALLDKITNEIFYGLECQSLTQIKDGRVIVHTRRGPVTSKIVIDATGWQADVIGQFYLDREDYTVKAIYGGIYPTSGFNQKLLYFIDGLEGNSGSWVMPISAKGAEVVAAQQTHRSCIKEWWEQQAEIAFAQMVDWYSNRGYQIVAGKDKKPMAFRIEPARRKYFQGPVVPFGEAAGLNSPHHGQLIDVLPYYARMLARIIQNAKETEEWKEVGERFYGEFLKRPPYYYLLHSILRENKRRIDGSKTQGNYLLFKALRETFDETTLWRVLNDNGFGIEEAITLLKHRPIEVINWILSSTPSLLSLLVANPDLFLQFYLRSCDRLSAKLRARGRNF